MLAACRPALLATPPPQDQEPVFRLRPSAKTSRRSRKSPYARARLRVSRDDGDAPSLCRLARPYQVPAQRVSLLPSGEAAKRRSPTQSPVGNPFPSPTLEPTSTSTARDQLLVRTSTPNSFNCSSRLRIYLRGRHSAPAARPSEEHDARLRRSIALKSRARTRLAISAIAPASSARAPPPMIA